MLTKAGEAVLRHPLGTWQVFPESLLGGNPYQRLAAEVMFAFACRRGLQPRPVIGTIRIAATEANYREAGTGQPPNQISFMKALDPTVLPMGEMGLFAPGDFATTMALTPVGKSVALEALRKRATGPGAAPWD